jgi:SPP1 gp7 family putative phage head morphogenesis protein
MKRSELNYYQPCDKAIKAMDRESVEAFGQLKMAKWERVNIIRTVVTVYRTSVKKARRRYYEVAFEAYILAMIMLGEDMKKAQKMADEAITMKWVDKILDQTDFVTLYRFTSEAERKAYRLAEQLEVSQDRNRLIDRGLRDWTKQLGQYAIEFTDEAVVQAFKDAGVKRVQWITEEDERTCHACNELHGMEFPINEIPPKPHYGCRCMLKPIE